MDDFARIVHDLYPEIPDVKPKRRVCWHGNVAQDCSACERDRVRKRKEKP